MNTILVFSLITGFTIVYHHLLYPLMLRWLAARSTDGVTQAPLDEADLPRIHLILPAFNESKVIGEKIRNLATLDYPADKLEISLIGDGCTDDTIQVARQVMDEPGCEQLRSQLEIMEFHYNQGKIAVLNQAISSSTSDIVALSDISALISCDGLRIAAKRFQDADVAVVNSSYHFAQYSSEGEKAYWQYQSRVKQMESRTGSVIGAHGALYFFRRALFTPLQADTINDDFILPMTIVGKGYTAVHEADIVATELECVKPDDNNNRRKRIAAGNLQQAMRLRHLLSPGFKGVAFNFLSGKVLRLLMPICLMLFYIASLVLAFQYSAFALLALGQTVFYGLAIYQHRRMNKSQQKLLAVIYYFAAGHWYSFVGMTEYLLKKRTFKV